MNMQYVPIIFFSLPLSVKSVDITAVLSFIYLTKGIQQIIEPVNEKIRVL